jgi:hypothetical protein
MQEGLMTNEEMRLSNVVSAQLEALHHWRQQADLDYVKIQRMYHALLEAREYVENNGGDPATLSRIDDALSGVRPAPPKVFR